MLKLKIMQEAVGHRCDTSTAIGPLADREIRLSSSQVYRLVTERPERPERPERLSLKVLMALLDILTRSGQDHSGWLTSLR